MFIWVESIVSIISNILRWYSVFFFTPAPCTSPNVHQNTWWYYTHYFNILWEEETIYVIYCNQSKSFLRHPSGLDEAPPTRPIHSSASYVTRCHHQNNSRVCCTSSGSNYIPAKQLCLHPLIYLWGGRMIRVFFFLPLLKTRRLPPSKYHVQQAEGAEKHKRHNWLIIKLRIHVQYKKLFSACIFFYLFL